jgi:hypothetical protein
VAFPANFITDLGNKTKKPSIAVCFFRGIIPWLDFPAVYYGPEQTGVPSGAPDASEWFPLLKKVSISGQTLNPQEGKITFGSATFEVSAENDTFLNLTAATEKASSPPELKPQIGIIAGYSGRAWADWGKLFRGIVRSVEFSNGVWKVSAASLLDQANGEAMSNADKVNILDIGSSMDNWESGSPESWTKNTSGTSTITEADKEADTRKGEGSAAFFNFDASGSQAEILKNVTLEDNTYYTIAVWVRETTTTATVDPPFTIGINDIGNSDWLQSFSKGSYVDGGIWSAAEAYPSMGMKRGATTTDWQRLYFRFRTQATGSTTFDIYVKGGTDILLASRDIYLDSITLDKRVVAETDAGTLALALIGDATTVAGVTWKGGDPSGAGLNSVHDVDGPGFADERDQFLDYTIQTEWVEPIKSISYLEEEVFRTDGFAYQNQDQKLAFKAYAPARPGTVLRKIDQDNIVDNLPDWRRRLDLVKNRVEIFGDWNSDDNEFSLLARVNDTASQSEFGIRTMTIESKLLKTEFDGVAVASDLANRLLDRFKRAREQLGPARAFFEEIQVTIAEALLVTHSRLPNIKTGVSGQTDEQYEVLSLAADLRNNEARVVLLKSPPFDLMGWIAPDATPDFTSASDEEKLVAFMSDDADSKMSDNTDPYTVQ